MIIEKQNNEDMKDKHLIEGFYYNANAVTLTERDDEYYKKVSNYSCNVELGEYKNILNNHFLLSMASFLSSIFMFTLIAMIIGFTIGFTISYNNLSLLFAFLIFPIGWISVLFNLSLSNFLFKVWLKKYAKVTLSNNQICKLQKFIEMIYKNSPDLLTIQKHQKKSTFLENLLFKHFIMAQLNPIKTT